MSRVTATAGGPARRRLLRWLGGWLGFAGLMGSAPAFAAARPSRERVGRRSDTAEPVDVALGEVAPGEILTVQWQDRPVFIRHRTEAEIRRERAVPVDVLRDPETDQSRTQRAEWVVVEGICTHGGCVPDGPLGDFGGWYCLCHGSQFDTAGRVRAGPARQNLNIPPHRFVADAVLRLGGEP